MKLCYKCSVFDVTGDDDTGTSGDVLGSEELQAAVRRAEEADNLRRGTRLRSQ